MKQQDGFTLIELLVVISIIGVLAAIAISGFKVYRASAAYAVVESTLGNAILAAEAGLVDADNLPAAVPVTVQTTAGSLSSGVASAYLPGMQIPKNVRFQVEYIPTCTVAGCTAEEIVVRHCFADEYARWIRAGDGLAVRLTNIAGAGC